jgi:hypothetical protein
MGFFPTNSLKTFLILRGIQRDGIMNVHRSSFKVSGVLAKFE